MEEILEELIDESIKQNQKTDYLQAVQNSINFNVLEKLIQLAINENATPQVKAITNQKIDELANWLNQRDDAISGEMYRTIKDFREHPQNFKVESTIPKIPDGSPIGSFQCN